MAKFTFLLAIISMTYLKSSGFRTTKSIMFHCENFCKIDYCGETIVSPDGKYSPWSLHTTINLPEVMAADPDGLLDYVLYTDGFADFVARYRLNEPVRISSRIRVLCIRYEYLRSTNCLDDGSKKFCRINTTLIGGGPHALRYESSLYDNGGWTVANVQYNELESGPVEVHLEASILGNQKSTPKSYIAVRLIEVIDGECPAHLGPRRTFWIGIMIVFSVITIGVFLHLAIRKAVHEHRKRNQNQHSALFTKRTDNNS